MINARCSRQCFPQTKDLQGPTIAVVGPVDTVGHLGVPVAAATGSDRDAPFGGQKLPKQLPTPSTIFNGTKLVSGSWCVTSSPGVAGVTQRCFNWTTLPSPVLWSSSRWGSLCHDARRPVDGGGDRKIRGKTLLKEGRRSSSCQGCRLLIRFHLLDSLLPF